MAWCGAIGALAVGLLLSSPVRAGDSGTQTAGPSPGFHLFPVLSLPLGTDLARESAVREDERPLRLPGDPDSLFTLGSPAPSGKLRLMAAFEINDVVLRALRPDPWITPDDPRGRPQGDYSPIDSAGRPYQLRLGARLVW